MSNDALEQRITSLAEEITRLQAKFDDLDSRFSRFQGELSNYRPEKKDDDDEYATLPDIDSNALWDKAVHSALLPRIATTCFILVFALILRTLTDNNIIGAYPGSLIGLGYAVGLIAWSARLLNRQSKLAAVFQICGIVLMYSVTLEVATRFATLSAMSVYVILLVLMIAATLIGTRHNQAGMNSLALFGTCVVASIIDFPENHFLPLSILLLTANILAHISAKKIGKGEWNRLSVFIVTMIILVLWGFRLQAEINLDAPLPEFVARRWFIPMMALFAITFMVMPVLQVLKKKKASLFDVMLPVANALWAYPLMAMIINTNTPQPFLLGFLGVSWACVHFIAATYLIEHRDLNSPAITSFALAGGVILLQTLPPTIGNLLFALPLWSTVALLLAIFSKKFDINGVRAVSYLLQGATCLIGIGSASFQTNSPTPLPVILIAGLLMMLCGAHYYWCRRNMPSTDYGFFSLDRKDISAVIMLVASLFSGFFMLRVISYQILLITANNPANALIGIQSLLINLGALALLFIANKKHHKEILTIAVLLIIIGGFKVFCYDLFKSAGMSLVLGVLSFGVLAAVSSIILTRWSSKVPSAAPQATDVSIPGSH